MNWFNIACIVISITLFTYSIGAYIYYRIVRHKKKKELENESKRQCEEEQETSQKDKE